MMKKISIVASLLGVMVWQAAHAGGVSPFYVGAGYGITNNNTEEGDLLADCRPDLLAKHNNKHKISDTCSKDDKDKAWNIYGGVNISQNFGIEVGYTDLGNTADLYYSDPISAVQETNAISLAAVGRVPLGKNSRASVYGKAGVARWKSETTVSGHFGTAQNPDRNGNHVNYGSGTKVSATGTSPVVGVGLEYDVSSNAALRVGWDRYYDVGEESEIVGIKEDVITRAQPKTLKTDVDVISAGMNYSFY